MGQIIAFAGKGGTGKSSCVSNIGYALAELNKKVLIIDCDCGMRTQDLLFNIQNEVVYNFNDVINKNFEFENGVLNINENLDILCAPQNIFIDEIDFDLFSGFINEVNEKYDFVLIDCPATLTKATENIFKCCHSVVVISDCTLKSARAGDNIAAIAEKANVTKNYLIINKINIDTIVKNGIINSEEVLNIVALPPIGAVPYDKDFGGKKKSSSKKAFNNIALRLTGEKVPVL